MSYFVQIAFAGIALGCIYALIGLGFSIIFKASEVINFSQGELMLVGTYVVSSAFFAWHLPFLLALLLGVVVTVAIGVLFERIVLRRMIGRPVFSILMITIGLDIILRTLVPVFYGSGTIPAASPFAINSEIYQIGVYFPTSDIWTIVITILICGALFVFLRYTKSGLAMRATALDQEAALAVGINIRQVYALAWGIAAAIAAVGGVFFAINSIAIDPTFGGTALLAFPAIILGGIDSVGGAILGGIIIGVTEQLTAGYETSAMNGIHLITPYLIMILVLLIRPYGLFGTRKVERI